jgi:hypothetical protein
MDEYSRECPHCKQMKDWAWEDFKWCEDCDPTGATEYKFLNIDNE